MDIQDIAALFQVLDYSYKFCRAVFSFCKCAKIKRSATTQTIDTVHDTQVTSITLNNDKLIRYIDSRI